MWKSVCEVLPLVKQYKHLMSIVFRKINEIPLLFQQGEKKCKKVRFPSHLWRKSSQIASVFSSLIHRGFNGVVVVVVIVRLLGLYAEAKRTSKMSFF